MPSNNQSSIEFMNRYHALAVSKVSAFMRKNLSRKDAKWLREDLLQAALMVVVYASKTYDSSKGVPEKAYVVKQIEIHIFQEFDIINFIPSRELVKIKKLHEARTDLESLLCRPVTHSELADFIFEKSLDIADLLMLAAPLESIDLLQDRFLLYQDFSLEESVELQELVNKLREALDKLPSLDREILVMLYWQNFSLQKVGDYFKISKQSILESRNKSFKKLRRLMGLEYV